MSDSNLQINVGAPAAAGNVSRVVTAALETLFLGVLLPALFIQFCPSAFFHVLLPSLVLGPLVAGLHNGFYGGTVTAALLAAVLILFASIRPEISSEHIKGLSIAFLITGMLAGESRGRWAARVRRQTYLARYQQTRMEQFSKAYKVLHVSHDLMEKQLANEMPSLRASLQQLRQHVPPASVVNTTPFSGLGGWLLDVIVGAGGLYSASLYQVSESKLLVFPPAAEYGKPVALSQFHPLLRETLKTGSLTAIDISTDQDAVDVIAVVPLTDSFGHMHGIVSIHAMPFLNISEKTLDLLAILGSHIGDILANRACQVDKAADHILKNSLYQTFAIAKKHGLPATVTAFRILDPLQQGSLIELCCNGSRGLDQNWIRHDCNGKVVVIKAMPLTSEVGAAQFARSVLQRAAMQGSIDDQALDFSFWSLKPSQSPEALAAEIVAACDGGTFVIHSDQTLHQMPEA